MKNLWLRRSTVTKALSAAAAEGDRSENAEYIYRKKELREIDKRIRYLQKRLPTLTVVSKAPKDTSIVFFGAEIRLEDQFGERITYRIVGPDEINTSKGWISMDAPVARALLKKKVADVIQVETPKGEMNFTVISIAYRNAENDSRTTT